MDSAWDMFQSVLRIPAGAALAASVFGADNATMAMAAALMGTKVTKGNGVVNTAFESYRGSSHYPQ